MINFIVWIIAGAVIGWVASIIMRTNRWQGTIADIVVGIVGAFVGGYILSPLFHVSTINEGNFSIPALLVSLGGAVILLAVSKFVRCIGWVFVILLVVVAVYTYYTCWSLASTSLFCTTVHALPFLR